MWSPSKRCSYATYTHALCAVSVSRRESGTYTAIPLLCEDLTDIDLYRYPTLTRDRDTLTIMADGSDKADGGGSSSSSESTALAAARERVALLHGVAAAGAVDDIEKALGSLLAATQSASGTVSTRLVSSSTATNTSPHITLCTCPQPWTWMHSSQLEV